MSACRAGLLTVLLVATLLVPTAGAFATREEPLRLAYERAEVPAVFGAGALRLAGDLRGGFLATDVREIALREVPEVKVRERAPHLVMPQETTYAVVTVVVHSGTLVWLLDAPAALDLTLHAGYGMALALPQFPLPQTEPGPGVLVAGPDLTGGFRASGAGNLLLLDAEVTLLDAQGRVISGWERRDVNEGASTDRDPGALDTLVSVSGAFGGSMSARVMGGAVGPARDLRLTAAPAETDRFEEALDVLSQLGSLLGQDAAQALGPENPMRQLSGFSGMLNGALLVLGTAPGGGTEGPEPVEATLGDEPFDVGPFGLLRGDPMQLAWDEEQMRVSGTPTLAVSRAGFAVDEPATVWLFPVVSVVLWAIAAAAVVVFFVKRPPKGEERILVRYGCLAVYILSLAGAFVIWDVSFADTFGTSVLTLVREGAAMDDLPRLGMVLALETAPWGLVALLFALPVRIAAGVVLRYAGKGKSLRGLAQAAGVLSLALLGPFYALWVINVVVAHAFGAMPALLGS